MWVDIRVAACCLTALMSLSPARAEVVGFQALEFDPLATSADGSVVVGEDGWPGDSTAVRWTRETGMVRLSPRGSVAYGVSADGSIVVGADWLWGGGPLEGPRSVWIWDQTHGLRDLQEMLVDDLGLDLDDWHLLEPADVSDDGRVIVGRGQVWSDETQRWTRQGFRAVIPEPSTLVLLGCGVLFLWLTVGRHRRHGRECLPGR